MTSATSAIFRTLARSRRSCRRFQTDRVIPAATLRDILETSLRAPSSFNLQPTQIILVQDASQKEQLAHQAMLGPGNQFRTKDASALCFLLTDLQPTKRIERIYQLEKDHRNRNRNYLATLPMVPSFLIGEGHLATWIKNVSTDFLSNVQAMPMVEPVQAWGYKNTALVAQSLVLAAESHELATCMMEGYDGRKVQDLLEIPDRYAIPLAIAIGYEYKEENDLNSLDFSPETPRLPVEEIVFDGTFGRPWSKGKNDREAGDPDDDVEEGVVDKDHNEEAPKLARS